MKFIVRSFLSSNTAGLTFFLLFPRSVQVIFEHDANLPLIGQIFDEGVSQQGVGGRPVQVVLYQAAVDERQEPLWPWGGSNNRQVKSYAKQGLHSTLNKQYICDELLSYYKNIFFHLLICLFKSGWAYQTLINAFVKKIIFPYSLVMLHKSGKRTPCWQQLTQN